MSKILFVLKRREDYNAKIHSHIGLSTGLYNSAKFMHDMLIDSNIESKLVVVQDNNAIDREVTEYRPDFVIIEALWVVPEKFSILQNLHPNVKWIIRIHSEMPFMSGEGIAMDWIAEYSRFRNVIIGINAPRMLREIKFYVKHLHKLTDAQVDKKVIYLPNYYPTTYQNTKFHIDSEYINIGCFGAIRPLKNHLVQAIASIEFADKIGKKLRFHVNAGRIEMRGDSVINNLKGLFQQFSDSDHELINHTWCPREDFLDLCSQMDIGLQVSFSETFNIVGCDLISQGIPLVGSKEIPWISHDYEIVADPTDSQDIIDKLMISYRNSHHNVHSNQKSLTKYVNKTKDIWLTYFKENS